MTNKPSIAILIDCWDTDKISPQWMYENIVKFINETEEIETVVLANYENLPISPKMLEINKKCVTLTETSELLPLLQVVENIYVMGANWTECVKVRPLGYIGLSSIPNIRILTVGNCVQENGQWVDFSVYPEWMKLKDNTYLFLHKQKYSGNKKFFEA